MAASGVSKCGAPDEEHTSLTGMVLAVPGVLGNRHGTVVVVAEVVVDAVDVTLDVVDVGNVALVATGRRATATVDAGPPLAASRLTPTPHPAAKASTSRTRIVYSGTRGT